MSVPGCGVPLIYLWLSKFTSSDSFISLIQTIKKMTFGNWLNSTRCNKRTQPQEYVIPILCQSQIFPWWTENYTDGEQRQRKFHMWGRRRHWIYRSHITICFYISVPLVISSFIFKQNWLSYSKEIQEIS